MAIDDVFWAGIDAEIAAQRPRPTATALAAPSVGAAGAETDPGQAPRDGAGDWTVILDNITAARALSQRQDARLRDHDLMRQAQAVDLERAERAVEAAHLALEAALTEADARIEAITADADARVCAIEGQAEGRVRAAEDRARAAEARAALAEDWLSRIEDASRGLTLGALRAVA